MKSENKELRVSQYDSHKKIIYNIKEYMLSANILDVSSGTSSAGEASKAVEALVRLGYVTYENIKSLTIVEHDRKITKLVISIKKTANFDKLYKENEEFKKKKQAEREAQNPEEKAKP